MALAKTWIGPIGRDAGSGLGKGAKGQLIRVSARAIEKSSLFLTSLRT